MTLKKIRLELARDREHPEGSNRHGYEFVGPLDEQGNLDAAGWKKHRERCRVRRFWLNEADEWARLRRADSPSSGSDGCTATESVASPPLDVC